MTNFFNSWLSRHSLNFKLNISILTCVCLGFFALMVVISEKVEPIIKAQIDEIAQKTINVYAVDVNHMITETERVIFNTKNTLSQMTENDVETLRVVLNSAIKTVYHSELSFTNAWLYVFPPEDVSTGKLYISTDLGENDKIEFKTEEIADFYARFPWFKEVPKEEKIYWSEPYLDKQTNQIVVTALLPFMFRQKDDFNGLVALTVSLSDMQKKINDFTFYKTGRILLLSRSGLYIAHPDPEIALKMTIFDLAKKTNLPELARAGEKLIKGISGKEEIPYSTVVDGAAIFYFVPLRQNGWGMFLVFPKDEFLRPIRQFQLVFALSLLFCVFLLLIIINRICHNSTNQLIKLGNIAEKYGKGDLSEHFQDVPSTTDISRLSGALSDMRTNLLDYIEKERQEIATKQKAESELDIARHIQASALSTQYPDNSAFKLATTMISAKQVSGDFYDFFFIDENKFAVVVADVSGKGVPAALYMMKAITLIKNISKSKKGLDFVFKHVNEQLCERNDTCMFVTAFMAVVDIRNGKTKYINAGHTLPLLGNSSGFEFLHPCKNIILGINPKANFVEEEMVLAPDTHLFLYTDGVTEAENADNKFYGEERLLKVLQKAKQNPQENLDMVLKDVKKFVKNYSQSDDITMLDFVFLGAEENSVSLAADMKNIAKMIDFLKKDMRRYALSKKAQFNMAVAAEEIFSNIVEYSYKNDKNKKVLLKTKAEGGFYYMTFVDDAEEYNPLLKENPDITLKIKDRKIGGLGVYLFKKLSDVQEYEYKNGQNILKIGISINK